MNLPEINKDERDENHLNELAGQLWMELSEEWDSVLLSAPGTQRHGQGSTAEL